MKQVLYWGPQMLGATLKNIVVTATWCPGFVHTFCTVTPKYMIGLIPFISRLNTLDYTKLSS